MNRKEIASRATPKNRVQHNDSSMSNGLMSTQEARHYDWCCGIHGAARARRGAKKASSAARRRLEKDLIREES